MRKAMLLAIALCLVFTTQAVAQEPVKIGVVSLRKILVDSEAGKQAQNKLKAALEPEKKALEKEEGDIKKATEDLKKLAATLSPDGKQQKFQEMQKRMADFQTRMQNFQKRGLDEEGKLFDPIKKVMVEVIHKHAQDNKFTLVLTDAQGGVVFAAQGIDLTDRILGEFNKAWASGKR